MRPVYKRTLWSLSLAFQGVRPRKGPSGEELPNSRLHGTKLQARFAVVLFKGDWEWHQSQWQMSASWKAPKRLCHLCVATKVSKHGHGFCDFGANFERRTVADFLQLLPQPLPCDLVHVPGFHHQMIRFCAMHALALGVYQSLAADTLLWMCHHNAFDTGSTDLDVQLQHAFEAFKIWMKRSGVYCSGRQFTSKRLHVCETDYPWLAYKAFNCRVVIAFLADPWLYLYSRFQTPAL